MNVIPLIPLLHFKAPLPPPVIYLVFQRFRFPVRLHADWRFAK